MYTYGGQSDDDPSSILHQILPDFQALRGNLAVLEGGVETNKVYKGRRKFATVFTQSHQVYAKLGCEWTILDQPQYCLSSM